MGVNVSVCTELTVLFHVSFLMLPHSPLAFLLNYMPHCICLPSAFDSSVASNFASAALIIIPDLVVDETCGFLQLALSLLQMCVSRKCPN